jgi:hypothetical protein
MEFIECTVIFIPKCCKDLSPNDTFTCNFLMDFVNTSIIDLFVYIDAIIGSISTEAVLYEYILYSTSYDYY